jgi:chaperonin cofactor prefoldin
MENQNTPNPAVQETSSRVAELLSNHFKTSSSTKTAFSFLKVLAILFIASFIWSSIAESSLQFTFPIVAFLYVVFVFGQIIIKENDARLKQTNTLAKTLQVMAIQNNQIEEELESYKEAHKKNKLVIIEWEKAHSYLKAENTNLTNNFSNLQDRLEVAEGRLSIADKNLEEGKKQKENFDKLINKAKTEAYILAIQEYDEYTTLNRSIPQTKDEEAVRVKEARRDSLGARIDKAKAMSEQG